MGDGGVGGGDGGGGEGGSVTTWLLVQPETVSTYLFIPSLLSFRQKESIGTYPYS